MLSLVEIGPALQKEKIFQNFVNVFSLFHDYFPLEMGKALYLNKLESSLPNNALSQVWLKLAQWFWRRSQKCEKFTDEQTDRQTDSYGQQAIRKAHMSCMDQHIQVNTF